MNKLKVLVCPSLNGKYSILERVYDKFLSEKYDKLVFFGGYTDGNKITGIEILRTLRTLIDIKENHPDDVTILYGPLEWVYKSTIPTPIEGFRKEIYPTIQNMLNENNPLFEYAYQIENFLFTHAGVQKRWFDKYDYTLEKVAEKARLNIDNYDDLAEIINCTALSGSRYILNEPSSDRGIIVNTPIANVGGPLRCSRSELLHGPMEGFTHVVCGSPTNFIHKVPIYGPDQRQVYNTSVIFTNVLHVKEEFLTLNIMTHAEVVS